MSVARSVRRMIRTERAGESAGTRVTEVGLFLSLSLSLSLSSVCVFVSLSCLSRSLPLSLSISVYIAGESEDLRVPPEVKKQIFGVRPCLMAHVNEKWPPK